MAKLLAAGVVLAAVLGLATASCTSPAALAFLSQSGSGAALPRDNSAAVVTDEPVPTEYSTTTTLLPRVAASTAPPSTAPPHTAPPQTAPPSTAPPSTAPSSITAAGPLEPSTVRSGRPAHPPGVLVVGDSILEGLNVLGYRFGSNTVYDTEVSRSVLQLEAAVAEHEPLRSLVIHLGTNGWWPTTSQSVAATLRALEDRQIVLVNISVDRAYTQLANAELAALAEHHDHVTLVDWNRTASDGYVRDDGYHPNMEGYEVLARLIADALGLPASYTLLPPARDARAHAGHPQ